MPEGVQVCSKDDLSFIVAGCEQVLGAASVRYKLEVNVTCPGFGEFGRDGREVEQRGTRNGGGGELYASPAVQPLLPPPPPAAGKEVITTLILDALSVADGSLEVRKGKGVGAVMVPRWAGGESG